MQSQWLHYTEEVDDSNAIDSSFLLGTWYTLSGVSKVRFTKNGVVHWRLCPYGLTSRRMETFAHEHYTLEKGILTLRAFRMRHRTKEGRWIRQAPDGSSGTRAKIAILTQDRLLCSETIFFAKDREDLDQPPFELVRKRRDRVAQPGGDVSDTGHV